jgi:DNA-directed RNA polymerase specialized sigma24 family protein
MARQVSDEAFSEFVHGAWPGLYRTAYLLLGDAGLAEDLVQTALAKTYAAWPSVRDVQAAPGFARTTLLSTASSWFRKRSWRNEIPTSTLPEGSRGSDFSDRRSASSTARSPRARRRAVGAPRARCRTGCRSTRSYGCPASPTRAEEISGRSLSISSYHRRRTW